MYNNKGLSVPVSILNPKSYEISTTNIGFILLSKNLTRRVKHVLNNSVDYEIPYARGVKWYCLTISITPCLMVYYIASVLFLLFFWCPCMTINVSV